MGTTSLRYPTELGVEQQQKKVQDRINRYKKELELVNIVLEVLPTYEGKPFSKHIANAINKKLPSGYNANLDKRFGMFHIDISCNLNHCYEKVISLLVGYENSVPNVLMDKIKEYAKCYTLNEERITKLEKGKHFINQLIRMRNEYIETYQKMEKLACEYEMDYDFDPNLEK